jgi:glycosyltransferase involved in cell wall biosynthesis
MKILLIHNFYRFRGGEDRYVKILEEILLQQGHRVVHFFSDSRSIKQFKLPQKCMIPFKLIHSPAANRQLQALLEEEKPDLAVAHNLMPMLSPSLLKVLKRNNIPILKRLENYKFLCLNGLFLRNDFTVCEGCKYGNFFPGIFYRCYQGSFFSSMGMAMSEFFHRRMKTVAKTSDLFLATSRFVKAKYVEAGFPEERIEVRPNFLDFEPFDAVESPADYAVFIGRLSREKGLLTLLKAFQELPDIPLKILGEGPMEGELKEFVRENEMTHVSFEGFVDGEAKREILRKALFLVFPSECYESFGYSIIESYACGVPVVASDIGGARELVRGAETGFLFSVGDHTDLRDKARATTADLRLLFTMKENALAWARRAFGRETGYRELARLFERLTQTGGK